MTLCPLPRSLELRSSLGSVCMRTRELHLWWTRRGHPRCINLPSTRTVKDLKVISSRVVNPVIDGESTLSTLAWDSDVCTMIVLTSYANALQLLLTNLGPLITAPQLTTSCLSDRFANFILINRPSNFHSFLCFQSACRNGRCD